MADSDIQLFHPLAINEFTVRRDLLSGLITFPHYLSSSDRERLAALFLSALRASGTPLGALVRLRWEDRRLLDPSEKAFLTLNANDLLWLVITDPSDPADEVAIFSFADSLDATVIVDSRLAGIAEHVQWMAVLKNALLDAMRRWWGKHVQHAEAKQVNFNAAARWFESPLDVLDYCNAIAAGLLGGHSLVYVERQAMASVLAARAAHLPVEAVVALAGFALRERWDRLRIEEPMPAFPPHFSDWQAAGLGWIVGEEFLPLPAIERLAERETLEPFLAHWPPEDPANESLSNFWDRLRQALSPALERSDPQMQLRDLPLRPPEPYVVGGTYGTPAKIREAIAPLFPVLPPESGDAAVQAALMAEGDEQRRCLLLAWRATLWLDGAEGSGADAERRAEADVARAIDDTWNRLDPRATVETARQAASAWARLRSVLADRLSESARIGDAVRLMPLAMDHLSASLAIFHDLGDKRGEANVLQALGDLQLRESDLAGARGSYESALPIYREIRDRLGEANVLKALGDLQLREDDLAGARGSYESALPLYREIRDRLGEANVLKALGDLQLREDDLAGARGSYESALPLYREIRARLGEANVLQALGDLQLREDDLAGARGSYESALPLYREIRARLGEANVLRALGDLQLREDDLAGARGSYESALPIYREIRDRLGEANVLRALGDLQLREDDLAGARGSYESALPLYREIRARLGEANVLQALGDLQLREDDLAGARGSYESALPLYREIRARLGEANVLQALGDLQLREDDLAGARGSYESALPLYREIRARLGEANVLQALGDLQLREDDLAGARGSYESALPLYREIRARLGEANVLASLGRLALSEGDEAEADRLLENAITLNETIGERFNPALDSAKYGIALKKMGNPNKARPFLLRAAAMFTAIGFDEYAATCRTIAEENTEKET